MSKDREYAKQIMQHYMELLAKNAGIRWNNDNRSEIDGLVDSLIDAAKEEIKKELAQAVQ